jgi:hypothetical protein
MLLSQLDEVAISVACSYAPIKFLKIGLSSDNMELIKSVQAGRPLARESV